jgi:hypothetical protein
MKRRLVRLCLRLVVVLYAVVLAAANAAAQHKAAHSPPVIKHEPVSVGLRDQPITIRAQVAAGSGSVKAVTLYYAASKDAAPYKVAMHDSGAGSYIGSIPAGLLSGVGKLSYYIEAVDEQDTAAETPWYTVTVQAQGAAVSPSIPGGASAPAEKQSSWVKPALIAGGAAALIGGGLLIANSGGGSSGGGGSTTNVGTYAGSVTVTFELAGSVPTTDAHAITISVVSSGVVSTDNLQAGQHLEGKISGSGDFVLEADVRDNGLTGRIRYVGHLFGTRITGYVDGTATSTSGASGTYSGSFSALRQ